MVCIISSVSSCHVDSFYNDERKVSMLIMNLNFRFRRDYKGFYFAELL